MSGRLSRIVHRMGIPEDVLLGTPILEMQAFSSIHILNYTGILELTGERIRVATSLGDYIIDGRELRIDLATSYEMVVEGCLESVSFCRKQE